MARSEKRRLCKFVSEWTFNNDYSSWLRPVDEDKHKAYCLLCEKVFPVSHGGLNDVKAHGKGKRHNFLKEQQENRARETSVELSSPTQGIFQFVNPKDRRRVLENYANVVVKESNASAPKEITIRREDDLTLDSAISESDCCSLGEMSSAGKMETPQQYCLRWKYHHSNLQVMFSQLLERESFCDVTLACEGKTLRAHKMMLSACSTYFDSIFSQHEENNPIVILKDVKFADIKALVEFMYKGEINVQNSHLSSLLKTAEELRIKGLAEVSWRSEGEGWRSVEGEGGGRGRRGGVASSGAVSDGGDSDSEPPPTKRSKQPLLPQPVEHFAASLIKQQQQHQAAASDHLFNPQVTSVLGNVALHSARNDFNDNGTDDSASESQGWDPPVQSDIYTGDSDNASSTPHSNQHLNSSSFNIQSADEERNTSFPQQPQTQQEQAAHLPDLSQYSDVVKMNEYLTQGGRRPQFWEEPFTRRVMEAIKNKELEMKVAAELMGVSYGTLYGRYRDAYGCLKHPYRYEDKRVRDFWLEQGPAEVLNKLQRKELTLFRAAEMLNVTVTTLANYLSTLRQSETTPDEVDETDADDDDCGSGGGDRFASARHVLSNNPDITIVKREPGAAALNGSK
ncbi:uncharacterized protein LOC111043900 isoform X2 [Nilaparvata lugens]|uniref:uncharacterized protein LOC111043900 isoform X2 n=1 Tax=Nilaparvata lugens TaxID=108931 RepID=UPI00193DE237|nr:uncharacterized protein LOC111043900 isoform X2 [Nilaparvata lugens]